MSAVPKRSQCRWVSRDGKDGEYPSEELFSRCDMILRLFTLRVINTCVDYDQEMTVKQKFCMMYLRRYIPRPERKKKKKR